jgi:hypothetical protein
MNKQLLKGLAIGTAVGALAASAKVREVVVDACFEAAAEVRLAREGRKFRRENRYRIDPLIDDPKARFSGHG